MKLLLCQPEMRLLFWFRFRLPLKCVWLLKLEQFCRECIMCWGGICGWMCAGGCIRRIWVVRLRIKMYLICQIAKMQWEIQVGSKRTCVLRISLIDFLVINIPLIRKGESKDESFKRVYYFYQNWLCFSVIFHWKSPPIVMYDLIYRIDFWVGYATKWISIHIICSQKMRKFRKSKNVKIWE